VAVTVVLKEKCTKQGINKEATRSLNRFYRCAQRGFYEAAYIMGLWLPIQFQLFSRVETILRNWVLCLRVLLTTKQQCLLVYQLTCG